MQAINPAVERERKEIGRMARQHWEVRVRAESYAEQHIFGGPEEAVNCYAGKIRGMLKIPPEEDAEILLFFTDCIVSKCKISSWKGMGLFQ